MSTKPNNTPRSPSYAAVASKGTAEEQGARVKQQTKSLSPVKLYLVVYNLVSALLWANLLFLTIHSVITHPVPSVTPSSNVISRYLFSQSALVPGPVSNFLAKLQGSYHHGHLGWWTKWTQSLAVLEVVHASLGWVRSPLGTTAAQVYSRLWTVWGVVESNKETHSSAFFTTMLFAWSFTEVIRYSYYVCTLLGISTKKLDKLRYTTFIPLYPLGASSEAALAFYTLPPLKNLPFLPEWIKSASPVSHLVSILPLGAGKKLATTSWGRSLLWKAAKSSLKSKTQLTTKSWGPYELWTLAMFVLWFPALYVMYMYMFAQRRKVLGKGRVLGEKKRA